MSKSQMVITYSAPNTFETLSLCAKHNAEQHTRYTNGGQPFAQVSYGLHRGTCDECVTPDVQYGKHGYVKVDKSTVPEGLVWNVPPQFDGQIIERAFATTARSAEGAEPGDPWHRTTDTSDGEVTFYHLVKA